MPDTSLSPNTVASEALQHTDLLELAGEAARGLVLAASDDFFARKENLIKAAEPVFLPEKYTDRGKWMDGWESKRRRTPGHDWALICLGMPGIIRQVVVDTRHFTGNYPEQVSLEACTANPNARAQDLIDWIELIPKSPLRGDTQNCFEVTRTQRLTHVRLNIFPDGGIARLRVHGEALPDWQRFGPEIDLAAAECGAVITGSSDQHYSHPQHLIMPGPGRNMGDGWETRRRRGPGHDWVTLRLVVEGIIDRVVVETTHFKGNFPDACSVDVSTTGEEGSWTELLDSHKLQAHTSHVFRPSLASDLPARFARFNIYPDGGVSRLRLFGRMSEAGRLQANIMALNATPMKQAVADFLRCGGSDAWAKAMVGGRPYSGLPELESATDRSWGHCLREDWLEAFSAHPRIGQGTNSKWAQEEQSRAAEAGPDTLSELEKLNLRYLEKFGYIFIVCAAGRTAEEMLDILKRRLDNDPKDELPIAAEQQRLITRLRLRKLLSE